MTASMRDVEAGAARIEQRVVAEDRVLEVPVTEEQARVERRVVDRPASEIEADAFQVMVSKEAIQHTEQVRGTVRREAVDVVDEGATFVDDLGRGTTPRR